jgi:hypothetical protein
MAPNSAFKDGKLIFLMYYFSLFLPSIPPSCSGRELFMGCGRLLQMGERNISKFQEGNGSQMLMGMGKEQVCQNPEIQMALQAGRSRERSHSDVLGWGLQPTSLRILSLPPPACQASPLPPLPAWSLHPLHITSSGLYQRPYL